MKIPKQQKTLNSRICIVQRVMYSFCILCVGTFLSAYAQTSVIQDGYTKTSNVVRNGDLLIYYQLKTDSLFDLSKSEVMDNKFVDVYTESGDGVITRLFQNNQYHYMQKNDTLYFCGYENYTSKINRNEPEPLFVYPLTNGGFSTGDLRCSGKYSDHLSVFQIGKYTNKVYKHRTLVLPSGKSISDIVHVCLNREFNVKTCLLESESSEKDTLNTFVKQCAGQKSNIIEKTDLLYASGYRYPVVERLTVCNSAGDVLLTRTFLCDLESQEGNFDPENEGLRNNYTVSFEEWNPTESEISSYVVYGDNEISISFVADKDCRGSMVLSDAAGFLVRSKSFSGKAGSEVNANISLTGLSKRTYVLYVKINNSIHQCTYQLK